MTKRRPLIVRIDRRRSYRVARRMKAMGFPLSHIARALRLKRERLPSILTGNALWSAETLQLFRAVSTAPSVPALTTRITV
jgi:hypothetical protein